MSAYTIELSSDDSDDSCRSVRYFCLPKPEIYSVSEDSQDSEASNSASASGISKSSQDNTRQKQQRKRDGSVEDGRIRRRKGESSAAERLALKKKLAEEKKAANEANKIYKPGECMKYMTIEMHPELLEMWYCADIIREANASGVKVQASSAICDTALVLWTRSVPPTLVNNQGMVEMTPARVRCAHGLYVCRVEDISELIAMHEFSEHIKCVGELGACKLTLVLFGVKDYFKSSGRKTANRDNTLITEIDLEKAIVDLLVSADCDTVLASSSGELALTVLHFTKAVAEEPYKKAKRSVDELAQFYMRGDNKKCVSVDKDGNGLSRLWQQMIAVLPMASLESSRALCTQYSTPLAMYEALKSPEGESDIGNVGVTRAALPGSKTRRVGPEFARKLALLFTATDGNTLID